jgi:methylisocitrate lyase
MRRAGAAGLHIEDQVFPKRCGHLDGKELISCEQMCSKVEWASKAAKQSDGFVLCARTDAKGVSGMEEAVKRARSYVEAGADMIFPEGLGSEAEFAQFAHAMRGKGARQGEGHTGPYLLANMTEFGKTPLIPLSKFAAMGYACVIYPVSMLRVAMGAVERALEQLKREGTVEGSLGQMQTRQQLYDLIEYKPGVAWEFPGGRVRRGGLAAKMPVDPADRCCIGLGLRHNLGPGMVVRGMVAHDGCDNQAGVVQRWRVPRILWIDQHLGDHAAVLAACGKRWNGAIHVGR